MAKGNFTTSQARLHLYQYLEELQDRVVHYDTDSVIYKATAIENDQLLLQHKGDLLGQLKDETGGVPIVKFAGAAPKAYSYVLANGKAEVKLRGITLDAEVSRRIHYESMKELVHQFVDFTKIREDGTRLIDRILLDQNSAAEQVQLAEAIAAAEGAAEDDTTEHHDNNTVVAPPLAVITVERPHFRRRHRQEIHTVMQRKRFQCVNNKGVHLKNSTRLFPYGY